MRNNPHTMAAMAKLWQKTVSLDALIEAYTVGRDFELDQQMLPADALASMAQARQLAKIGLLTPAEADALVAELGRIVLDWKAGSFRVQRSDEDCHTAIENRLTERLGDAGKKIHTGRSRNDQVLTALRVYGRSRFELVRTAALELTDELAAFAEKHRGVPMPGRTHLQAGMPSSVGLWAAAWAEELLDSLVLADAAYRLIDRSPLGFAASYGVPLPLDREYSAQLMGFASVHRNVLAASHSRGKGEAAVLDVLDQLGLTLSRMAQDLILFSLPEFGYFKLPDELCTGSSIMPQKKNPDALELTRAKSATLSSWASQVKNVLRSMPSGYNRDLQETKEPYFRGLDLAADMLAILGLTFRKLEVVPQALERAFTPDIFATDAAYELVKKGTPFRDAYLEVGLHLDRLKNRDPRQTIADRTHTGAAGNLGLDALRADIAARRQVCAADRARVETAFTALAGADVFAASGL
jgi:argininosuccinate lyase